MASVKPARFYRHNVFPDLKALRAEPVHILLVEDSGGDTLLMQQPWRPLHIYSMNADGTGVTLLTNDFAQDISPASSPKGHHSRIPVHHGHRCRW
jgi:hypothetical protein